MEKESLIKAQDKIFELANDKTIPTLDRMELLLNLKNFLEVDKYKENIKILQKSVEKNKFS